MKSSISRRGFLKISALTLGSMAFGPVFPRPLEQDYGDIARVTVDEIDLYSKARDDSEIIGKRYRDQIIHIYDQVVSTKGPAHNPLWYRVWGGYLHSRFLQVVKVRHNPTLSEIPEAGQLCEVTVPFSEAYQNSYWEGWIPWKGSRLYYSTTHWITGIQEGPDNKPWYELTSEIDANLKYYVPTAHFRPILDEEIAPLSAEVPEQDKRIEVSINEQTFMAYEYGKIVRQARISSGIPSRKVSPNDLPTATPHGSYRIFSKMPNKHMGSVSGNPDASNGDYFSLPGVPWTSFFLNPGGYAFHGTYWHNNFGVQMSHGCINMRNEDARWLFRWCTPTFDTPIESHSDWERRGRGTEVEII